MYIGKLTILFAVLTSASIVYLTFLVGRWHGHWQYHRKHPSTTDCVSNCSYVQFTWSYVDLGLFLFAASLIAALTHCIGCDRIRTEAANAGVAEYYVPNKGEAHAEFRWLPPPQPTK